MKRIFIATALAVMLTLSSTAVGLAAKPAHAGGQPGGGSTPLQRSVCIDPGHGGTEPGTSNGGIIEKNLNLDVALQLDATLKSLGYETYLTRTGDENKSNNDRYTFCNNTNASMLVSIHHNGSTDTTADYTMGLYQQRNSLDLTNVVGQTVASEFGMADTFRTAKFSSGVLIKSDMPSMMSEAYFLTNSDRLAQLQADYDGMVLREANALARGIEAHVAN